MLFAQNLGRRRRQVWLIVKYSPCNTPQATNCHPAPCHRPDRVMVTSVGKPTRTAMVGRVVLEPDKSGLPLRIRARVRRNVIGLARYAVRNRVSVMCHRVQKSTMLVALNGELKFIGSPIPNIRAIPRAMSE